MAAFTNELLEGLNRNLDAFGAASKRASELGIAMSPNIPFYRMGEPRRFQATPTSGNTPQPVDGNLTLPPNVTSFMVTNLNPFPIRLKGTRDGMEFQPVTDTTGWCFMPGVSGPFTTVGPVKIAVLSVDGPFAATDPSQKAGTGWLELQYGVGV